MGAFLVYLYLLLKDAETPLQKTIALLMMIVGLLGELATAGFGMMIEGWTKLGWQPAQSEYEFMILVIRIMMGIHGVALVLYWFGDTIIELMGDQDGDGIPNVIDQDYKPAQKPVQNKRSGLRFPWSRTPVVNQAVVGQPRFDISNLSQEQMMEIIKHAQELQAYNDAQAAKNGNGKVVTDPQNRQS
jgi:hypothetical protein